MRRLVVGLLVAVGACGDTVLEESALRRAQSVPSDAGSAVDDAQAYDSDSGAPNDSPQVDGGPAGDSASPDAGPAHDDAGGGVDAGSDGPERSDSGAPAESSDAGTSNADSGAPEPVGDGCTLENESRVCGGDLPACNVTTGQCVECRGGPEKPLHGQCPDRVLPACDLETNTCISSGNHCIQMCSYLSKSSTCYGNLYAGTSDRVWQTCGYWLNQDPWSL